MDTRSVKPVSADFAVADLSSRPREVFRHLVEAYLGAGEPVGSRTLSQRLPLTLSPASIRNIMADLEKMGLIYAPHTSAGRVPTERGLRLFVDGMLQIGDLTSDERSTIEERLSASGRPFEDVLAQAASSLSGLSRCAGLLVAEKQEVALRHVEFVNVSPGKALAVLVGVDGSVENRLIDTPLGLPPSALTEAANYLSAKLAGRTLDAARGEILKEIEEQRAELDTLTAQIVAEGIATLSARPREGNAAAADRILIVRGASNLLDDVEAASDLQRVRTLFDDIERKNDLIALLEVARAGEGVRVFIGSENKLFSLSGSSVVAAPYADAKGKVVGVIGIIGPTRLNYARIVPMVDYTARVIGRLLA
ncbi:MAG: heat-inducible transcriptional repressor HrcA [Alphaproteobacteria bacterium]|nr:heat-inducible transcriptional repressor HrcA [Alphaproteobacteria bacterium]